jgi:hypothetical protein
MIRRDVLPLEEVRDQIVAAASGESFTTWMQRQMRSADISVNPRYGTFDAATGQVEPVRSTDAGASDAPQATGATGP